MPWRDLAVILLFWAAFEYNASAQVGSYDFPAGNAPFLWSNESGTSDDWGRCSHRARQSADSILRSCNRILGERHGGEVTAGAYYFRGLEYELVGDNAHATQEFENAYRWFTIAMRSDRSNSEPRANRAVVLMHLGRDDEAIADYDAAIAATRRSYSETGARTRPNVANMGPSLTAQYQMRRGEIYFRRGDWANAIAAFDQAASLAPQDASAQSLRCEGRAAAGVELDAAETACDRAIELSDHASYAVYSRGFLKFKRGDFASAAEDFSAAFEKDDTNFVALYAAGIAITRLGRTSEGEGMITRAMDALAAFDIAYYASAGLSR